MAFTIDRGLDTDRETLGVKHTRLSRTVGADAGCDRGRDGESDGRGLLHGPLARRRSDHRPHLLQTGEKAPNLGLPVSRHNFFG